MDFPEDLRYTKEHEWARLDDEGKTALIGVTDYAQDKLGDVVHVDLQIDEEAEVTQEEIFGSVESVKAVSDLFVPLSGKILETNDALMDSPEIVNDDPYGEAWMIRIEVADTGQFQDLMDVEEYKQYLAEQEE